VRTLEPEVREVLRQLIDMRRREQLIPPGVKAPKRYTRCKSDEERRQRRLDTYRRYDIRRGKRVAA
jgi:hypothetical protein